MMSCRCVVTTKHADALPSVRHDTLHNIYLVPDTTQNPLLYN
jgi:hypothetical protein